MKQFYFCTEPRLSTPQAEQHFWAKRFAKNLNGAVVFYGAEEFRVAHNQPFILPKLLRTPGLDGVLFFSFEQFCLADRLNFKLGTNILQIGLSIHFVRENISFYSVSELTDSILLLSGYKQGMNLSSATSLFQNYWKSTIAELSSY
jgi:hypothetical protein